MPPRSTSRGLSRRELLHAGPAAGAVLALAACGAPVVVERVVVVPKVVEHEVIVKRPVVTERVVIVERPVVVERDVVVTRLITPPPTPTAVQPESRPARVKAPLRAAISPAFARGSVPDLSRADIPAELTLEVLDAHSSNPARLVARAAAGDLPDLLIGVSGGLVTALDALEMLAPLDDAISAEHEFVAEFIELGRREHGTMGMPVSGHPTHLLAGRQRLDLAGVSDAGATYDALGETARRLTDPETFTYGFGVVAGLPELETVAGSAGTFPNSERALTAWQWYVDLWRLERVSPPPSAWDGQGTAGEAVLDGRIALAIAHGRALSRLASLPTDRRAEWEVLPLPAWPDAVRRTPMAAAYIAAGEGAEDSVIEAAIALAGPAQAFDTDSATPAWAPALNDAAGGLGLELDSLLEAQGAWSTPIIETVDWRVRAVDLDVAVHNSLTLGQTARESAVALQVHGVKSDSPMG